MDGRVKFVPGFDIQAFHTLVLHLGGQFLLDQFEPVDPTVNTFSRRFILEGAFKVIAGAEEDLENAGQGILPGAGFVTLDAFFIIVKIRP